MRSTHLLRLAATAAAAFALVAGPTAAFASEETPPDNTAAASDDGSTVGDAGSGAVVDDSADGLAGETTQQPAGADTSAGATQRAATTPEPPLVANAGKPVGAVDPSPSGQPASAEAVDSTPAVKAAAPVAAEGAAEGAPASEPMLRDSGDPKKVYVCKYSGTPGVNEVLRTFNSVSVNALGDGFAGEFPFDFVDAQQKSIAIGYAGRGYPVLTKANCPKPQGPPEEIRVTVPEIKAGVCLEDDIAGPATVRAPIQDGVKSYTIHGHDVAPGAMLEVPHGTEIEWEAVLAEGYKLADGTTGSGTLGPVTAPECGTTPVLEPVEVTAPEINAGVCVGDAPGPATVRAPIQDGVKSYTIHGHDVAPGAMLEVPHGTEIEWEAVLAEGYKLADGTTGSGTLGPVTAPECGSVPVVEVNDVTAPSIAAGVCLQDGTAASATVTAPVQDGVASYVIHGQTVAPGGAVDVPYDTEIAWDAVLDEEYELADGAIGSGTLGPVAEPSCETEPVLEPVLDPVSDPTDDPAMVSTAAPVAETAPGTAASAPTGSLASTGANALTALVAAAAFVAVGALALVMRRRRQA